MGAEAGRAQCTISRGYTIGLEAPCNAPRTLRVTWTLRHRGLSTEQGHTHARRYAYTPGARPLHLVVRILGEQHWRGLAGARARDATRCSRD